MEILLYPLGALTVGSWLVFAGSSVQLVLFHRKPDTSVWWYAVNGYAFFSSDNCAESAGPVFKRRFLALGGFALGGLGVFLTVFLTNPPGSTS